MYSLKLSPDKQLVLTQAIGHLSGIDQTMSDGEKNGKSLIQ